MQKHNTHVLNINLFILVYKRTGGESCRKICLLLTLEYLIYLTLQLWEIILKVCTPFRSTCSLIFNVLGQLFSIIIFSPSGNVNMVERTNEQQKMLEKRKADLAERRRLELETAQQLEAQEEMGEELGKTYTSLQQEVSHIMV